MRGRKCKSAEERLEYKLVGMRREHWEEVSKAAREKGWSVNRYIRNVVVTYSRNN